MHDSPNPPALIDSRRVFTALWRRGWLVLILVLIGGVAGYEYGQARSPVYEATANVQVGASAGEVLIEGVNVPTIDPKILQATQTSLLSSDAVLRLATHQLGHKPSVSASAVNGSQLVAVTARANTPRRAAQDANTYVAVYLKYIGQRTSSSLITLQASLTSSINSLQQRLNGPHKAGLGAETRVALRDRLAHDNNLLISVTSALASKPSGAEEVTSAEPPVVKSGISSAEAAVIGALLLGLLGVGAALVLDSRDDRVRRSDARATVAGVPVLATVAGVGRGRTGSAEIGWDLVAAQVVRQLPKDRPVVQVCGVQASCPSDVAAIRIAESIDRSGVSAAAFDSSEAAGTELAKTIATIGQEVDVVVVSSSPLMASPAAVQVASLAGAVVLALNDKPTSEREIIELVKTFERLGSAIVGVVRLPRSSDVRPVVDLLDAERPGAGPSEASVKHAAVDEPVHPVGSGVGSNGQAPPQST